MSLLLSLLLPDPDLPPPPKKHNPMVPKRNNAYGTVGPRVLEYIKGHPDCTPAEMCEHLGINPDAVNRALRKMREKGLVISHKEAVTFGRKISSAEWRVK